MDLIPLLAPSAVATVAISAVGYLARNVIIHRLSGAIAHDYAVRLERTRAELSAINASALEALRSHAALQQSALAAAFTALTSAHIAGHERTLTAIEKLWEEVRRIRNWMPLYAVRTDIFQPEEMAKAHASDSTFRLLFQDASDYDQAIELTGDEVVEKVRPFVGEYLYALFFAYRAFAGRVARAILEMHRKHEMNSWHNDGGVKTILRAVLTEEELRDIPFANPGRIHAVQQVLERKMLEHIARVLSGEASATFNLQRAREIIAASSTHDRTGA